MTSIAEHSPIARSSQIDMRLAVSLIMLVGFGFVLLSRLWTHFPPDLSALYMAGHLYGTGQIDLIYASPPGFFVVSPPEWAHLLPALGLADQNVLAFVYPPIWAAIASPLSAFGHQVFFQTFAVVEIAALGGSVLIAWRLCRNFAIPLWAWILLSLALMATSLILFTAMTHLQPQIIVVFLILLAFERYDAGKSGTAGALLALAAVMKLSPAGLVLIFLLDRNWRALAVFSMICAAFALASVAIAGLDLHRDFLHSTALASEGVFVTTINYSFETLLHGAFGNVEFARHLYTVADTAYIPLFSKAVLAVAMIWMILRTSQLPETQRLVARLFLTSLLISLFGPLSWAHYFLPQVLLLPGLIGLLRPRLGVILCVCFAITTSWGMLLVLVKTVPGDFVVAAVNATTMVLLFICVTAKAKG